MDYLEHLFQRNNDALLLRLADYAKITGISLQTARNQLAQNTFPIPTLKVGRNRMVRVADLAEFLQTGSSHSVEPSAKPKRSPGRPRKYEPRVRVGGAA